MRAFQKSGYIIIEVEDDGQGLNRPRVLKKAREKGLVSPEESLSEYQIDIIRIIQLTFQESIASLRMKGLFGEEPLRIAKQSV